MVILTIIVAAVLAVTVGRSNWPMLLLILLTPVMFYVDVAGSRLNLSASDPLLLVIAAGLAFRPRRTERASLRAAYAILAYGFLLVVALSAVVVSLKFGADYSASQTLFSLGKLGVALLYAAICYRFFAEVGSEGLSRALGAWSVVAILLAIGSFVGVLLGVEFLRSSGTVRAEGTFEDPNLFACYLVVSMAAYSLWLSMNNGRIIGWGHLAMVAGMLATGSRGGLVAVLAGGLAFLVLSQNRHRLRLAIGATLAVGSAFYLGLVDRMLIFSRLKDVLSGGIETSDDRALLWAATWDLWVSSPLLGIGLGNFPQRAVELTGRGKASVAHNTFLTVLAELGIAGLLVITIALAMALSRVLRAPVPVVTRAACLAGIIGIAVAGATINVENARFVWAFFGIVFAATAVAERSIRERLPEGASHVFEK